MGKFAKLRKVDLPYKTRSGRDRPVGEHRLFASEPFYETTKDIGTDGLTILDDFEFQGIDFGNIRDDDFQMGLGSLGEGEDDEESSNSADQSLNFQEYSVSYMERDSTVKIVNYKKQLIDEEEINKQAQSSPKLRSPDLDHILYNLSLDELDFQLRGDSDESMDAKQPRSRDTSFDLDHLLNAVKEDDTDDLKHHIDLEKVLDEEGIQLNEEVNEEDDEDTQPEQELSVHGTAAEECIGEEDTMDVDTVLSETPQLGTHHDEKPHEASSLDKLNGLLAGPALTSKASKIPIRYYSGASESSKFQIHHDPVKYTQSHNRQLAATQPSLYHQTLKKSARLQPRDYHRILKSPKRICSPKRGSGPLKPAIRIRRDLLNLIVDAASGDQREAARYGSEINSQNCEGVPLPESTKELVTIPTNNVRETHKAAIIKAVMPAEMAASRLADVTHAQNRRKVGFYNEKDFYQYVSTKKSGQLHDGVVGPDVRDKENDAVGAPAKRLKTGDARTDEPVQRHVKWADNLEW